MLLIHNFPLTLRLLSPVPPSISPSPYSSSPSHYPSSSSPSSCISPFPSPTTFILSPPHPPSSLSYHLPHPPKHTLTTTSFCLFLLRPHFHLMNFPNVASLVQLQGLHKGDTYYDGGVDNAAGSMWEVAYTCVEGINTRWVVK